MKFSAPLHTRVQKDTVVRIYRTLQGKGKINVSKGQQVTPSDIIGESFISSGFRIIKLAQLLSVSPQEVEKYLKKPLGQRIYKDELLAYKKGGLFEGQKNVISPTDGILDFLNPKTGDLRMNFLPKKIDLPAGVFGIVEVVDETKGEIIIRTVVSIVHGIFGSGRLRDGTLHIIGRSDELIGNSFISTKLEGHILIGGSLVFRDAISSAISSGVSGIITGGINAKDYKAMAGGRLVFPKKLNNDIGISVIVCEGFGSIPIGDDIYEMFKQYDGKFVSINGNTSIVYLPSFESSSINKVKNTHLPPIQENRAMTDDVQLMDLRVGLKVRVAGNSFAGAQGKLVAIDQLETLLPSGIKTFLATIETKKQKIQLPVANLEIIDYSF